MLEVTIDKTSAPYDAWIEDVIIKPQTYGGATGGVRYPYHIAFCGGRRKVSVVFFLLLLMKRLATCETRHYIRADAVEQVVTLELRKLAIFLKHDEDAFADILSQKTNKEMLAEQKHIQDELQKSIARQNTVSVLYEKLYEDNLTGKVTDEWFMQLSHKYEVERAELKAKISTLKEKLNSLSSMQQDKDTFITAVRKFMQMETLTTILLRELIDHIDVYETQGKGKSKTQKIVIYYRFVGYIEVPVSDDKLFTNDTRQGVAVSYISKALPETA